MLHRHRRFRPCRKRSDRSGTLCASQLLQQCLSLAEPRPLPPLHVPRQGSLLRQQLLRPLARLFAPVRCLHETRIVVKRFRRRRNLRDFREKRVRAIQLSRSRVGIRQQSPRPVIIELSICGNHSFQVWNLESPPPNRSVRASTARANKTCTEKRSAHRSR